MSFFPNFEVIVAPYVIRAPRLDRPGSVDWPHLPDGQRDTGEILNLLADWAPDEADRRTILVDGPDRLFFRCAEASNRACRSRLTRAQSSHFMSFLSAIDT